MAILNLLINLPFVQIEQIMLKTQPQQKNSVHLQQPYQPASPDLDLTSNFLKKQISRIIKEELKTYGLRNKLQAELQSNHKHQIDKHMIKSLFEDKMSAFKSKEQSLRRKKQEDFIKRQKDREEKLKTFMKNKKESHQEKFQQIQQQLTHIKQKHNYLVNTDSKLRLSKLRLFTSGKNTRPMTMSNVSSRVQSRSHSQHPRDTIREISEKQERELVTNYMRKIEQSESRVLMKEIDNERRIQTSKNSRVKCLVEQRNRIQVQQMDKVEREYNTRMEHFAANRQKVYRFKQTVLMNRSTQNFNKYRLAVQRREENKVREQSQIESKLMSSKENVLQQYRSCLDMTNNHRNMRNNLNKLRNEEKEAKVDSAMRLLTEKLQKIRNVKYGQKLDENSLKIVLSMLDRTDPQFNAINQFLRCERRAYLEGVIQKEEERSKFDKSKKGNKLMSKTTTL